jgi:NADPH-dependent curcumin reductase CurA
MNKRDWQVLGALGGIGGGVTALHGLTSQKWTRAHTVFTIAAAAAGLGALLSRR